MARKEFNREILDCDEYGNYYCKLNCNTCGWNRRTMHEKLVKRYGESIACKLESIKLTCYEERNPISDVKMESGTIEMTNYTVNDECSGKDREYCCHDCTECGWNIDVALARLKKMRRIENGREKAV